MFVGIVQGLALVEKVERLPGLIRFSITTKAKWQVDLKKGASIAIDGVCLTVTRLDSGSVFFDVINETLERTTLKFLTEGQQVNFERSAKFGTEIGGHVLSGHIFGTAEISKIETFNNNHIVHFSCPAEWMKYILRKGYVAIDGASLTVVDVDPKGTFTVHLIPETLSITTLGFKKDQDLVNVEIDSHTQAIVETVERILATLPR